MEFFDLKIAGAAGEGIKVSGLMLQKTCLRSGWYTFGSTEYPSLIRGGHNTYHLTGSHNPVDSHSQKLDLLIALNDRSLAEHAQELTQNSIIVANQDSYEGIGRLVNLPLIKLAKESGNLLTKNTVALGATVALLGLDLTILITLIAEIFKDKKPEITLQNHQAAQLGFDYIKKNHGPFIFKLTQPKQSLTEHLIISGNEAVALGAVAGGMKLYCAYPMTPTTAILHCLADNAKKLGIIVHHAEDEIGVINLAVGAGFAGVRTMVGTSGGGFCLMTEGLGLAGGAEIPIVIVLGMRAGPSTGMPTWSGQGDMLFALNASQDEFPRIILAPGDPGEAFSLTALAQNLAEKYQLPVIILTDKNLGEHSYTIKEPAAEYNWERLGHADNLTDSEDPFPRYRVTDSGISPRSLPGQAGGIHLTNSYEHDELGYATESSTVRTDQMIKRLKKLATIAASNDIILPRVYGPKQAETSLISWGSNKGALINALTKLPNTNLIHFSWLWPFPAEQFMALVKNAKRIIGVEANATGQLAKLIRQETGLAIKHQLLKFDGRQFYPEEIINFVTKL